jgi:hypothetical protein
VSETLTHFLVDLASDPNRMQAFLTNPRGVLDQSTLTAGQKSAVLSRDNGAIRRALGVPVAAAAMQMFKKGPATKKTKNTGSKKKTGGKKKSGTRKTTR